MCCVQVTRSKMVEQTRPINPFWHNLLPCKLPYCQISNLIVWVGWNAWPGIQTSYNFVLRKFDQLPTFCLRDSNPQSHDYQTDAYHKGVTYPPIENFYIFLPDCYSERSVKKCLMCQKVSTNVKKVSKIFRVKNV